jgi:hypothetical protein
MRGGYVAEGTDLDDNNAGTGFSGVLAMGKIGARF